MRANKVIVVEDDEDLRQQVVAFLAYSGFDAAGVPSAAELYRRMAVERFDVVVLDLRLPGEDGLSIATHLRAHGPVGIIMATARGAVEDRLRGLEAGADAYLPKPVDLRELAAVARTLLRRLETPAAVPGEPADAADGWRLDRNGFTLTGPNGRTAALTTNEMMLLARLSTEDGGVVTRGELLGVLGYDPNDPSNRNLDAALRRLRLKVEDAIGLPLPLRTVHTVGYLLSEPILASEQRPPL